MHEPTEQSLLDVVEEFQAANQSEAYEAAYKTWRRRKDNRYAFRFRKNPKESSFSENQTVVNETPAQAEQSTLRRIGVLFGYAFLCYLLLENVFDKLAIHFAQCMGVHIESLYWGENRYYGEDKVVFLFSAAFQVIKLLVPMLIISFSLRMPLCVSVPVKIHSKRQFLYSLALTMLLSVGLGISLVPRSAELDKYRLISEATISEHHWLVLYILFTVFIAPAFWELLFHSSMFQVLRQFGDGFAVGMVTILAALLTHNLNDALRIGLLTLTVSYFMIKTGSFLTAVILRIVHEIYMFSLFQIESNGGMYSLQWWITVLFPCVVGLLSIIVLTVREKEEDTLIPPIVTYMNVWDQGAALFTSLPMMGLIIVCTLLFIVKAMLG